MSIHSQNKHVNLQVQIQNLSLSYKFLLECHFILAKISFFLIEIVFTYYKIHHPKACNLVGSSTCSHHHQFQISFLTQKETLYPLAVTPHPTYPNSRQPQIYFLPCMYLLHLNISFKQSHTVCSLSCLVSILQHVFTFHPCHSMCQYFIPLHG